MSSKPYTVGADLSFLKQAEDKGVAFKGDGQAMPGLRLFREHGYRWIRLRLFHTPTDLPNSRDYTIALAKDAVRLGYRFLLDLHYSDTWADPAKQFVPRAWEGRSHAELVDAVFEYTRDTLTAFDRAGAFPDMVQIGNEIIGGMLWPDGRLPAGWDNLADLLKAGVRGVDAGRGRRKRPVVMIHIDRGADQKRTQWFFDHLNARGVPFDVIGQSYYPWWHGPLRDLRDNLQFMARAYDKDIVLVETAYCWRPTEYRDKPGPFPETPAGQRDFLAEVDAIVRETPRDRGKGIFWWEPAVPHGPLRSRGLFDDDGNALPALTVFDRASA